MNRNTKDKAGFRCRTELPLGGADVRFARRSRTNRAGRIARRGRGPDPPYRLDALALDWPSVSHEKDQGQPGQAWIASPAFDGRPCRRGRWSRAGIRRQRRCSRADVCSPGLSVPATSRSTSARRVRPVWCFKHCTCRSPCEPRIPIWSRSPAALSIPWRHRSLSWRRPGAATFRRLACR